MIYNTGWGNLKPQKLKYTPALAAQAAKLLESGESLTATARSLNISRASLRNWRDRDPALNAAFTTFEANKTKAEAKRERVRQYKQMADGIVDAAREGAKDPIKAAQDAQAKAKVEEIESKPLSPKEAQARRLQLWWESDWSEEYEAQQARLEAEKTQQEIELRKGFWCG
jgi:hypothetical protein